MKIPRFDLSLYVYSFHSEDNPAITMLCGDVTRALKEFGAILVEVPRFLENINHEFVTTMQTFFSNLDRVQHPLVERGNDPFHIQKTWKEDELQAMPVEYNPRPVGLRTVKEPKIFSNTVHSMAKTMLEVVNVRLMHY
jgi:hypothetical protein